MPLLQVFTSLYTDSVRPYQGLQRESWAFTRALGDTPDRGAPSWRPLKPLLDELGIKRPKVPSLDGTKRNLLCKFEASDGKIKSGAFSCGIAGGSNPGFEVRARRWFWGRHEIRSMCETHPARCDRSRVFTSVLTPSWVDRKRITSFVHSQNPSLYCPMPSMGTLFA